MEGFEVEYFSEIGTGPRYRVDVETGEISKDSVFMHGEGPISDSDTEYPGSPENVADFDTADQAYQKILDAGLEPGEVHIHRNGDRDFRIEVYGDQVEEVDDVDEDFVYDAIEELEQLF